MTEASLKPEELKTQKLISLILLKVRIAWVFFLLIVINPLIKSWLNPEFNWSDVISFGHITREFPLFSLILLALGLGLYIPWFIGRFSHGQNKIAQHLIRFFLQCCLFTTVPILGFSIALKENNPSLVFFYALMGVLLLSLCFPTRHRWKLTPEEEKELLKKSEEPRDEKHMKNRRIGFVVVASSVVVLLFYKYLRSHQAAKISVEQCRKDCFDLFNAGELQPGVTAEMCIDKSCN